MNVKLSKHENISFEIDFKQFFDYYKVINSKHLEKRIGMNESLLSQYVNGKKNPSKKQVERIIDGLHQIGKELTELILV
jgi:transcriptional regulator with XRE-family HTH domain